MDLFKDGKKDEKHDPCSPEHIKGGLAEGFTPVDIARKHAVPIEDIEEQLAKGTVVERKEHCQKGDKHIAAEIAKDHLMEHPYYYTFLAKMEKVMDEDYEAKGYGGQEKPRGKSTEREEEASKDSLDPEIKKKNTIKRLFG